MRCLLPWKCSAIITDGRFPRALSAKSSLAEHEDEIIGRQIEPLFELDAIFVSGLLEIAHVL